MDPITVQYTAYNQRRLHYSLLFWACLALQFSGILFALLLGPLQTILNISTLFGLIGTSSLLMAFIAWRLHGLEIYYETLLRRIENYWINNSIEGIQKANITGKFSSRKLVILALAGLAALFLGLSISHF